MYRSDLKPQDKTGAIVAVVAVHALLALGLLHLSGKMPIPDVQSALKMFDTVPVPPPPPPPPPIQRAQVKPKQKEAASAPTNIKSHATPVKRVSPPIQLPVPVPTTTTATPNTGSASTQGAGAPGIGTGAGGSGAGTGSGSGGNGNGGGDGGIAEPPHLATPKLSGRDIPRSILDQWPSGARVDLNLRIDPQGYVIECNIGHGTGVAAIDSTMCDLARERLRFRPALNRVGQPVAGWFGYGQQPPR